jgi:metal-responsive CopG/Arc/MetJ family transcriptional regulator
LYLRSMEKKKKRRRREKILPMQHVMQLSLNDSDWKRIHEIAKEKEFFSRSELIRIIIRDWIKGYDESNKLPWQEE